MASIKISPAVPAVVFRSSYTLGIMEDPRGARPNASETIAIVFAVNCPAQAPVVGKHARSSPSNSSSVISLFIKAPTASNASNTLTSLPRHVPGKALPPNRNTEGTLQRTIPIIRPGKFLSQPPIPMMPSYACPLTTSSTLSAINSRDTRENFIPSWFMDMPSETVIVVNSLGVPPPANIPLFAANDWEARFILHGVISPAVVTTPTKGLAIASSSIPMARINARCGTRSKPSVVIRERNFLFTFMTISSPLF